MIAITCKVKQEEDNDSGDNGDNGNDDPPEEPEPPRDIPVPFWLTEHGVNLTIGYCGWVLIPFLLSIFFKSSSNPKQASGKYPG